MAKGSGSAGRGGGGGAAPAVRGELTVDAARTIAADLQTTGGRVYLGDLRADLERQYGPLSDARFEALIDAGWTARAWVPLSMDDPQALRQLSPARRAAAITDIPGARSELDYWYFVRLR